MTSNGTKGKQQLHHTTAMTQTNPKFIMGQSMLTHDELHKASQPCIDLHNYYNQNYEMGQNIIVSFKDHYFLVDDDIFLITFFDLFDLLNLDTLDISLILCFAL
jgi:hypothetical protein